MTVMDTAELVKMFPKEKQVRFHELAKQMVREYDPDYTKVTEQERVSLLCALKDIRTGEFVTEDDILWD